MPLSPSSMAAAAASIPQFYSNYAFATAAHDLADFSTTPLSDNNTVFMDNINAAMWGGGIHHQDHDGLIINHHPAIGGALDHVLSLDCDTVSSPNWVPTNCFGEQPLGGGAGGGVSDFVVPAISNCKMELYNNGCGGNNMLHHQSFRYQPRVVVGEFAEECCGFVEDVKPPHAHAHAAAYANAARDNWGIQGNQMAAVEEPNIKVGRYSEEERKERIVRYLKKRNQRNFNKTIKYACRKTLADRRVRVRGRFARNNELCEDDMATKKHHHDNHHHHLKQDFYAADSIQFQLKNDEEDWLQEAMASLVYLSHSSPEDM